ncbi:hypothetical protein [Mycolicibacterium sp. P1-5]|uniref:hypothetical protein n=1 Tax=Mycolicibacterium sp. P1-5 TaxID=2024617 RepID=UPI0011F01BA5|nr:hypothetical protein [Mycolicibacterium sp. P1-5]KAA0109554.1 hypothetical protein CIW47_10820 [Mycolicibacterium sp. P1-5]
MIGVLTSGVALGVHVPGLLLAQRLRERGADSEVFVLERLLPESKRATTAKAKFAFHRNFRVALAGQRLAVDPSAAVTEPALEELAEQWRARGVQRLVVLSGFWLPLVERCAILSGHRPEVDICHLDSVLSPSFRAAGPLPPHVRQVLLADWLHTTVPCTLPVSARPPVRWSDRDRRLLVHGGGWGMGTYRQRADELHDNGFELDIVAYEACDVSARAGVRYFMIDPSWHPWIDDGYPPFARVDGLRDPHYVRGAECHGSFELARTALAMVSKPGGGTMLDSVSSATPLVLLEPFGEHEARNAELWERLGFGISLQRWREANFAVEVLQELHETLVREKPRIPDYVDMLTEETCQ